ncbi:MAG: hypothetical protein WBR28_25660 [Mycobacterium sp.]
MTPNSAAICATVYRRLPSSPVSAYIARASVTWRGTQFRFLTPGAAARPGRGQPMRGPLRHQGVLEFGDRSQDLEEHPPDRSRGIDTLVEHHQIDTAALQGVRQLDQLL